MQLLRQEFEQKNVRILIRLALLTVMSTAIYWLFLVKPAPVWKFYNIPWLNPYYYIHYGDVTYIRIISALVLLAFLYWQAWVQAKQSRGILPWVIVIIGSVIFATVLLYMAPINSNDVYDYIIRGRITGVYNDNPFIVVPAKYFKDPLYIYSAWRFVPSAYGPIWEIMAGRVASIAGDGVVENLIAFKLLSGVFFFGSILLVALILRQVKPQLALPGTVMLAWNPIVLYTTFADGHNDIVMAFFVLLAIWAIINRRYTISILALVAGILVKFLPVLLIPAAFLIALRDLQGWDKRIRFFLVTGVMGLLFIGEAYAPFWKDTSILEIGRRASMFNSSVASALYHYLTPKIGAHLAAQDISRVAAALTFAFALWISYRAFKNRSWTVFSESAVLIFAFYSIGTILWFWPWYSIWIVALAPVVMNKNIRNLALVFGFWSYSKTFIFAKWFLWPVKPIPLSQSELWLALGVMGPMWIYSLYLLDVNFNLSGRLRTRINALINRPVPEKVESEVKDYSFTK